MGTKIVIELQNVGGNSSDPFATVYTGGQEFRLYVPSKASGDPLGWFDQWEVRQPSPIGFGGEMNVLQATAISINKIVKEELERLGKEKKSSGNAIPNALYYHVRIHVLNDANIEPKFDLSRAELESRILERYQNLQPFVISG